MGAELKSSPLLVGHTNKGDDFRCDGGQGVNESKLDGCARLRFAR